MSLENKKPNTKNFLFIQGADNPLKRVDNAEILKNIIDPRTGNPYEGIVLEGEFASIDCLNNNNRYYTEENYLGFIKLLKSQIHTPKGLYGQLEHPKGYANDYNLISHKILDIWYDTQKKKVFGIVLLLNTPKGLIAQEIVASGGQLGISARGGGSENKNNDGTFTAVLKLLVTFDLVYHPGFTTAELNHISLNENNQNIDIFKPTIIKIYEKDFDKMDALYESYIMSPDKRGNFLNWLGDNLNESSKDTEKDLEANKEANNNDDEAQTEQSTPTNQKNQEKLQNSETTQEDEIEDDLSDAVDDTLSESQKKFYNQMQRAQIGLNKKIKKSRQGNAYFDNSAGFINNNNTIITQKQRK